MLNIPRFSIVTPAYIADENRKKLFLQCIESVKNVEYDHEQIEHIIVNDGSPMEVDIPTYPWITVIDQSNLQRLTAYNNGLKATRGEIIGLLDSDDEITPGCLGVVDRTFRDNPAYSLINGSCGYIHPDGGTSTRPAFRPKEQGSGHEVFGGGTIVNGTFFFSRKIYDSEGAFPEGLKTIDVPWYKKTELFWTSPYDFSAYAQCEFPEIQQFFQVKHPDHPKGLPKELGNPWGQDYYLFYKYTRKYKSKAIEDCLITVHTR